MLIGDKWKVVSDRLNVTLYERGKPRPNASEGDPRREGWYTTGYYSSVGAALVGMVDNRIADTHLKDFREVVKKQDELYRLVESLQLQQA